MDRRSFTSLLGATLFGSALFLHAQDDDHGHGHGHKDKGEDGNEDRGGEDHGHGNGHGKGHDKHDDGPDQNSYFRQQDYGNLTRYYTGPRNLPPGLRKKYFRTGTLPPGWQKLFQPMPAVVIQQLPPLPPTYQRGYLDGYAVVVNPRTRVIVDAIDILNASTGR